MRIDGFYSAPQSTFSLFLPLSLLLSSHLTLHEDAPTSANQGPRMKRGAK
jgi:hypothetical protein